MGEDLGEELASGRGTDLPLGRIGRVETAVPGSVLEAPPPVVDMRLGRSEELRAAHVKTRHVDLS